MIPRLKPRLGLAELLAAFHFPSKNDVTRFEKAFAEKMGTRYAIAFPYGRTALRVLLEALKLKDKEIITPSYTCAVVQHAIVFSGNRPIFLDSQQSDYNMDLSLAPQAISQNTGALIATSIFGYPVNLDQLDELQKKHNLPVIQDCCHSMMAHWKGRPVHKAGVAAIYGLNISKMMNSIFGGMITTDDSQLYEKVILAKERLVMPSKWQKSLKRLIYLGAVYPAFWGPIYSFVNFLERKRWLDKFTLPMDDSKIEMPSDHLLELAPIEARVGLANLGRYDQMISDRKRLSDYYFENIKHPDFRLPPRIEGATYSHFVGQVTNRPHWIEEGLRRGLQFGQIIEYSVPEMSAYGSHSPERFPVTARYSRNTINLPIWGGLELAKKVVKAVNSIPLLK